MRIRYVLFFLLFYRLRSLAVTFRSVSFRLSDWQTFAAVPKPNLCKLKSTVFL